MEEQGSSARGLTTYVSIGMERNSKSVNVSAKASVWLTTPTPESLSEQLDHSARVSIAERHAIGVAVSCAAAFEELIVETVDRELIDAIKDAVNAVARELVMGRRVTEVERPVTND